MLVIIYLTKNLESYVRLVMLCEVMVRLRAEGRRGQHVRAGVSMFCVYSFLNTFDYSRLWFIYLLLSLFNE